MHIWDIESSENSHNKATVEKKDPKAFYAGESFDPKQNFIDITALIRSLQRAEGENDCFRTAAFKCYRTDCRWREYCCEG